MYNVCLKAQNGKYIILKNNIICDKISEVLFEWMVFCDEFVIIYR